MQATRRMPRWPNKHTVHAFECVGLTCPISSGFNVINVQLWQTTRQQNWLSSVCKLMYCPDTFLPQCGRKLRILWISLPRKVSSSSSLAKRAMLRILQTARYL